MLAAVSLIVKLDAPKLASLAKKISTVPEVGIEPTTLKLPPPAVIKAKIAASLVFCAGVIVTIVLSETEMPEILPTSVSKTSKLAEILAALSEILSPDTFVSVKTSEEFAIETPVMVNPFVTNLPLASTYSV